MENIWSGAMEVTARSILKILFLILFIVVAFYSRILLIWKLVISHQRHTLQSRTKTRMMVSGWKGLVTTSQWQRLLSSDNIFMTKKAINWVVFEEINQKSLLIQNKSWTREVLTVSWLRIAQNIW